MQLDFRRSRRDVCKRMSSHYASVEGPSKQAVCQMQRLTCCIIQLQRPSLLPCLTRLPSPQVAEQDVHSFQSSISTPEPSILRNRSMNTCRRCSSHVQFTEQPPKTVQLDTSTASPAQSCPQRFQKGSLKQDSMEALERLAITHGHAVALRAPGCIMSPHSPLRR